MPDIEDRLLRIAGVNDANQPGENDGLLAPGAALPADAGQGLVNAGDGAGGDGGNGGVVENNADEPVVNPVEQVVANAGGGAGGDGGAGGELGEGSAKEAPKDLKAEKKAKRKRRFNVANGIIGVVGSLLGAIGQTAGNINAKRENKSQALADLALAGNIIKSGTGIYRSGVSTVNAARTIHKSRTSGKEVSGHQKVAMWGNLISALAGVGGGIGGMGAVTTGDSAWTSAAKWSEVLGSGGGLLSIIGSGR